MNIIEIDQKYHLQVYKRFPAVFVKGEGVYLYDEKGEKYLDFLAGIGVNALGQRYPEVVKAIKEGADELLHISNLYYTPSQALLAKKLVELSGLDRVFFLNSGSEANELALKAARKYGMQKGRFEFVALEHAFHGRTMGALSVTGKEKYKKGYKPLINGVIFVPPNDLKAFESALTDETAAVIMETIQGEGGMTVLNKDFVKGVRERTKERDILLIIDEIQTGMGRTGKIFSYFHFDIKPDIVTVAKALGGGLPIGATIFSEKVVSVMDFGAHGSTFGGNPLITKVALKVLNIISDEKFLKNVEEKGDYFREALKKSVGNLDIVREIRGKGLMVGVELKDKIIRDVAQKMFEKKILIGLSGDYTLRFLPPLIVEYEQIDEVVRTLKEVLSEF